MSTIKSNTANVNKLLSKKRTWYQVDIDDDYEEEQKRILEKKERVKETLKKIMEIRLFLVSIGEYDLEDGEIL